MSEQIRKHTFSPAIDPSSKERLKKDQLQESEHQYNNLDHEQKAAVKQVLIAARVTRDQMSRYLQDVAHLPGAADVLPLIEQKTTLVKRDFAGYYQITPDLRDALAAYLADK